MTMTRQDDNICKRIESTEKFVPFSPSAKSYGMGCKTLQAVRYRESPASGEFSLPPVSRHGLVLTIRPAERLEVRYEGVRLDRPPAAELRTGGLGGSLLVESVANVLAVHLIRYITGPGRLKAAADGVLPRHKVPRVIDYIIENLGNSPTLEQMAELVYLSEVSFDKLIWMLRQKRDEVTLRVPEWEQLRDLASIKEHTLSNLGHYLEMFEAKSQRNGVTVHWARDGHEHNHRIVRPDGGIRAVRVVGYPVHDKGVVTRFIGAFADITEREQLTQDLRQSEFYLNEGQRLAHAGSWAFDSGGFDYWSPELFRIHGLDPAGKAPTVREYLDLVHPEDREFMANLIKRLVTEASPFDITKRIVRPDGEVRDVRCVSAPVVENQKLKKFVGTAVDITEYEFLTQELRRREAYLAQAEALSHTGSFGWNPSSGQLSWSDETFSVFGYDQSVTPSLDLVLRRVHPDNVALMRETLSAASKDVKNLDYEHKLLMPDGSIKHVHVLAQPLRDQRGNVEFVGSVMDVTTTKEAFEEIKALKDELDKENIVLREEVEKTSMFQEVVGTSPALQRVLARAAKVAPTDSTVLILGETGTGKELIARAIHKRSQRSTRAFVSVNCAAIPTSLITSELFGHEKGAFTGAIQRRLGRFELAEGGTLFLDEIGELLMETQIALLRVLQEREFERVGGTEPLRANVRVIAATNRDLQATIVAGTFRSDLFYRLNVFPIVLPPLRERKEDIPALGQLLR
jgi:PAS domain S-box-containing protein